MIKKTKLNRRDFLKQSSIILATGVAASGFPYPGLFGEKMNTEKNREVLRFIHVTDSHLDLAKPDTIKWVEMMVKKINKDFSLIDFVLFGGDNFNNNVPGNKDAIKFKQIIDRLQCPWYAVRGNKESTPKPKNDPLGEKDFAKMFFKSNVKVIDRDWKLKMGKYVILGIDSTLEQQDNGKFSKDTLSFVKKELKDNPTNIYIILDHHPYENYWGSKDKKDIHKYVLNNANKVKRHIFKYPNLLLTLSGHKHLDYVGKIKDAAAIATVGFVVPQDPDNIDDHRFRYVEIKNKTINEKLVSII